MFLAEYQSLREESAQARTAQQTILQWSLGAFALIFAGAMASDVASTPRGEVLLMIIFGLALPGLVFGSCLAWAGELLRMERAGYFLRGREAAVWASSARGRVVDERNVLDIEQFPLLWENFIASAKYPGARKQQLGYIGALVIYGLSYSISAVVFFVTLWNHEFGAHTFAWRWWTIAGFVCASIVMLVVFGRIWLTLRQRGREAAGLGRICGGSDDGNRPVSG
jgi:hypothetical protein